MLEGPRDDAPLGGGIVDALHGEALAAAGLPVREDGAVVALQHTLRQIETVSCHCYQTLLSKHFWQILWSCTSTRAKPMSL